MSAAGGEQVGTTDLLRQAAVEELVAAGQADFAMESVARRAFFSIGTVYNRWLDRDALLTDIARTRIMAGISDGLGSAESASDAIAWVLDAGQRPILAAGEIMLAGHTAPALAPVAVDLWQCVRGSLEQRLPSSMAWYVATYALGSALLGAIGVDGPSPATGRVQWFVDACDSTAPMPSVPRETATVDALAVPTVPSPHGNDDVARALVDAAQLLLAERGAAGTSTRDIAAGAGVTTGALYRRYDGKSGLLADVLLAQLQPDRYAWTWDLVQALASKDPFADSARVIGQRMIDAAEDEAAQRVLLQVGIAARNDSALQAQVADRIRVAHEARVEMARGFAATGLLREDVSPEVLVWGFQTIPVGVRATLPLGVPLDLDDVRASMGALLRAAARPG